MAVTGHMGFKGSWLCMLLARLGARSFGYGQDDRTPLLYPHLKIANHEGRQGNVTDTSGVRSWLMDTEPEFLIHLAAQPIVLDSYDDPMTTFQDNIMGTAAVLEAARSTPTLKVVLVITSDKVYRNADEGAAFIEDDTLGGDDPYSASKAAAEIVTHAMAKSFFGDEDAAKVATARAGNVIGGGDWAAHRLLPDAARSAAASVPLVVRNPGSVRPWQHVLDPLSGYLLFCEKLERERNVSALNFGPDSGEARSVGEVVNLFSKAWGNDTTQTVGAGSQEKKEALLLSVDSTRAKEFLDWSPRWKVDEAVTRTASWYRQYSDKKDPTDLVNNDLDAFFGES